MLRAQGIPCGFSYQKLILDDQKSPYLVLHGLNAFYWAPKKQWCRIDARGNKKGVNAQFSIEKEQLAFPVRIEKGEIDIPKIYAHPSQRVVDCLYEARDFKDLWENLPREI